MAADLISRAQAGDSAAFGELTAPFRRELQVHCYFHAQAEKFALGSRPGCTPAAFSDLVRVLRHGLRTIQRRPRLIEGCLAETGLTLETA